MTKTNKTVTDVPDYKLDITQEMLKRIKQGRLDYRKGVGWHDPSGYNPEQDFHTKQALSFTRR